MATKMRAGRDISFTFGPLKDQDGQPIDMSGSASAVWRLARNAFAAADAFVLKQSGTSGLAFTTTVVNTVTFYSAVVTLVPTDTKDVPPSAKTSPYYHELEVKDVTGRDYTFEMTDGGAFELLPSLNPPL